MGTLQKSIKNCDLVTFKEHFAKNIDFQLRIASGHVQGTLCKENRNFVDFDQKIVRIHTKTAKIDTSEGKMLLESCQMHSRTAKFPKVHDGDPTKID